LADARGILQVEGYKGYAQLYAPEPGGTSRYPQLEASAVLSARRKWSSKVSPQRS